MQQEKEREARQHTYRRRCSIYNSSVSATSAALTDSDLTEGRKLIILSELAQNKYSSVADHLAYGYVAIQALTTL